MIGSFLTRGLVMVFGYAYPAYECFKTVEQNRPDIQQLRFWCQYWILVATLTIFERVGDALVSWVPMYSEAKLAFFIYLWYPKTKGTTYVYDSFFRPYIAKHENEIDRNLIDLKTRAGDMAVLYCQKAVNFGHTRFLEILQFIALQSTPKPPPKKKKPEITELDDSLPRASSAPVPLSQLLSKKPESLSKEPSLKSNSSPRTEPEVMVSQNKATPPQSPSTATKATGPATPGKTPEPAPPTETEETLNVRDKSNDKATSSKETIMEEKHWLTRGKLLRKTRSTGTQ